MKLLNKNNHIDMIERKESKAHEFSGILSLFYVN